MEKYILTPVFMLAIMTLFPQQQMYAESPLGIMSHHNATKDHERFCEPGYFKLSQDGIKKSRSLPVLHQDTGKHYRKFFFYGPEWRGKFADSLFSGLYKDSVLKNFRFRIDSMYKGVPPHLFPGRRDNSVEMPNMLRRRLPGVLQDGPGFPRGDSGPRKSSQSFTFRNTDKDGITTRLQIDVSDLSANELEKINVKTSNDAVHVQKLSFSPDFSTGKITLMFSLAEKGDLRLKMMDNDLNAVFTDSKSKFSGTYQSSLTLPRNGIYYLLITRQDKTFVKRILKTE